MAVTTPSEFFGKLVVAVLIGVLMLVASCDSQSAIEPGSDPDPDPATLILTPVEEARLTNGIVSFRLGAAGYINAGTWQFEFSGSELTAWPISGAGLWLAAEQGSARANMGYFLQYRNKFRFTESATDSGGIFVVTAESLSYNILNWPTALGAPGDENGHPIMYGDRMAWTALEPAATGGDPGSSLEGIRVGMSAFLYDSGSLAEVLFFRYDITNTSGSGFANLFAGFGTDTDIFLRTSNTTGNTCPTDANLNQTGYDPQRHVTYTYMSAFPEDGPLPSECYSIVTGHSILAMSSPSGLGQTKLAHRILRKHEDVSFPEFSQTRLTTAESILFALQGLSPTGGPMIDPVTGTATLFAFTGDPIEKTGWIDDRHDVRSLQSIQPFNLAPGETKSITVAWMLAKGENLADGIAKFKAQFDLIMSRRDAWDF